MRWILCWRYLFGCEQNFPSERLVTEPAMASSWRYRRESFWSKWPSPIRVIDEVQSLLLFLYYQGVKSSFSRSRYAWCWCCCGIEELSSIGLGHRAQLWAAWMDLHAPDADMQRTIVKEARPLQLIAEMHLSIKKNPYSCHASCISCNGVLKFLDA